MDSFGAVMEESEMIMAAQLFATSGQDQTIGGIACPNYYDSDNISTYSLDNANSFMLHLAQWDTTSSSDGTGFNLSHSSESQSFYMISDPNSYPTMNPNCSPMDFCNPGGVDHNFLALQNAVKIGEQHAGKRKSRSEEDDNSSDQTKDEIAATSPKKKSRSSFLIKKIDEKIKSQNSSITVSGEEEVSNCGFYRMNSGCYSSQEDSHNSQEQNGSAVSSLSKETVAVNLNGKKRASRGSATDPQSLYARKRRERINERLRILQNLVPNGTKVDISTMLDEAVQYVKFLQLQIKLLSSDDHWMYAPIAYNGMSIGLDLKISPQ